MQGSMVTRMGRRLLGAAALVASLGSASSSFSPAVLAQEPAGVTIDVTAERFSFTPSVIRTKLGSSLTIRLKSDDTDHGFRILETDVDVRIPKRSKGTTTVTFRPTREGRYTFECSHVCGAGHAFMRGTITVTK